ncbi:MAG: SDR family NAD(P)-dependent oxidoreductase [Pseudomonadota bacterium]
MRAVIIGASGGLGAAFTQILAERPEIDCVYALSRSGTAIDAGKVRSGWIDLTEEHAISAAAQAISAEGPVQLVVVATGLLSDADALQPEKSYRHQSAEAFERVFAVNTIGPGLVAKHFLPIMPKKHRAMFAAVSARVGSISDNRLGGWHAYRASKAALNMLVRNYAIELSRSHPEFVAVSLHPGTVDTDLSKPFQSNVPQDKLFTPQASASYLLDVMDSLTPKDSGKAFDWAGEPIPA